MALPHPWIIAHRGASGALPENTRISFDEAWRQHADGIEGDFQLTADGEIVCVHDADMCRVAGSPLVVKEATLEQLRALEIGSWKCSEGVGQRILTLAEVLALVPRSKRVFLEIKSGPEILPRFSEVLAASSVPPECITIISFDEQVIAGFKERYPAISASWLTELHFVEGRLIPDPGQILATLKGCGADAVGAAAHGALSREFVSRVTHAGYAFDVWTVNEPEWACKLRAMGVRAITTDYPTRVRNALQHCSL